MSEKTRSFFATIPGAVTGLAGLLTAVVGLITLLVQLDVIGGDDSKNVAATATTVAPAGGAVATTTAGGSITVDPLSLKLAPTEREKTLTVRNDGRSGSVTVLAPEFDGADKNVFRTDDGCTNKSLEAGRSCTLKVMFTPRGALKSYSAKLVLRAEGATRAIEVPVDASTLLG